MRHRERKRKQKRERKRKQKRERKRKQSKAQVGSHCTVSALLPLGRVCGVERASATLARATRGQVCTVTPTALEAWWLVHALHSIPSGVHSISSGVPKVLLSSLGSECSNTSQLLLSRYKGVHYTYLVYCSSVTPSHSCVVVVQH